MKRLYALVVMVGVSIAVFIGGCAAQPNTALADDYGRGSSIINNNGGVVITFPGDPPILTGPLFNHIAETNTVSGGSLTADSSQQGSSEQAQTGGATDATGTLELDITP